MATKFFAHGRQQGVFQTTVPPDPFARAIEAQLLTLLDCGLWSDDGTGAATAAPDTAAATAALIAAPDTATATAALIAAPDTATATAALIAAPDTAAARSITYGSPGRPRVPSEARARTPLAHTNVRPRLPVPRGPRIRARVLTTLGFEVTAMTTVSAAASNHVTCKDFEVAGRVALPEAGEKLLGRVFAEPTAPRNIPDGL
ncbi:hypothetical protein [Nocardia sp. NPDC047038]|uniref:hypothetical protein n=1 Tax=Nocardia sp. NPDC047038 TaxID=3154338 RepID=UPI0033EBED84